MVRWKERGREDSGLSSVRWSDGRRGGGRTVNCTLSDGQMEGEGEGGQWIVLCPMVRWEEKVREDSELSSVRWSDGRRR